jgi:hypothetical protein
MEFSEATGGCWAGPPISLRQVLSWRTSALANDHSALVADQADKQIDAIRLHLYYDI